MKKFFFLIFSVVSTGGFAQEEAERKWSVHGYVKDMVTISTLEDSSLVDNLIHNRLNFEWFPSETFTIKVGMRNRVFFGDLVKAFPNYAEFIDTSNDYLDMSITWLNAESIVVHSVFDRAYIEWSNETWEIRAGRQRINWGTNVVWNPNDIFNAYSFFDFDYEERPGTDALRIVRYLGFASSLEVAVKAADSMDEMVAAMMWKFNRGSYDIQLLSGITFGDYMAGIGWAGNLGNASFKGEFSFFTPYEQRVGGDNGFSGTAGLDYSFKNGLYLLGSYLYNSDGLKTLPTTTNFLFTNQKLSARNLMPFKHSTVVNLSYPFTPLINGGLAIMAFPGDNSMFVNPSLSYSVTQTVDLGLFAQWFYGNLDSGKYGAVSKSAFLRLKWSF